MKIALIYLGRKGAGPVYTIEMVRALLVHHRVMAVISTSIENLDKWILLAQEENNLLLYQVITYTSPISCLLSFFKVKKFWKIRNAIVSFKADIIYSTMVHPWNFILFSILPNNIITIRTIHDAIPHLGENNVFMRFLLWQERKADYLVTLTNAVSNILQSKGVHRDKIIIIPHAHMGYYNIKKDIVDFKICNRIAFFGRINEYKGLKYLCDAFPLLIKEKKELRLLIAGKGDVDNLRSFFDEYSQQLDLYIKWVSDNDVADLLQSVDIVVLPYIEASQSGVIPLAFSLGKPVIVTSVGGLSEQVPLNCGIIVPPRDVESLKEAILKLYSDPEKIRVMGVAAKKYADSVLTWEHSVELLLSSIKKKE